MKKLLNGIFTIAIFTVALSGCNVQEKSGVYTYNDYGSSSPTNWNPHTWENTDDGYILDYITMGLYDYVYNSNGGYDVVCEMAQDMPIDTTSDFVGDKWNISEGETNRAWKIHLNESAVWENGEKIDADSYIYSMQMMLNPNLLNRRADSYYGGELSLVGAESYLKQNSSGVPYSWDGVGLLKSGEYEITLILENAIDEFLLPYNLSSNWLVYKPLYEQTLNKTIQNAWTSTYGTSVRTTLSYGPYRLKDFISDKSAKFERNEKWYGYHDGKHEGQFQTTNINYTVISEQATALGKFEKGELDKVTLTADDMATYKLSDYVVYTPQSYTSRLVFNTNYDALAKRSTDSSNKKLLYYKNFRKALSRAIDRATFVQEATASHEAGFGLVNSLYSSNPATGEVYRNTESGKLALLNVYFPDWQATYKTCDEAYMAMTGYNLDEAKTLLLSAIEEAKIAGDYKTGDKISLDFAVYNADESTNKIFNFLNSAIKELSKGCEVEGKLELNQVVDKDYYNNMKKGNLDIIIGTWGGGAWSMHGLLSRVYTDGADGSGNQQEYGFDTDKVPVTISVCLSTQGDSEEREYTRSLKYWADALCGKVSDFPLQLESFDTKTKIFSALEQAHLGEFTAVPIYSRRSASLQSMKINEYSNEYLYPVEFGGIRLMTYNYDDSEWSKFIKQNGGTLNYK
jgi:oligopeptide transport system substrate-binding protein